MLTAAIVTLVLAAIPALLMAWNLAIFRAPQRDPELGAPDVSILIPARDEAENIGGAVRAALLSTGVNLEVLVLDDHSADGTAEIVQKLAEGDRRLRLLPGEVLPEGWAGKMFACWSLANAAKHDWLLFVDADVRLAPTAARRLTDELRKSGSFSLISGPPRQITESWAERMLIPLIHFVLLGYLPIWAMRRFVSPAFGAAVGQLIFTSREAYFATGGHSKIRTTFHDGLNLARITREAGKMTDLADLTDFASCRMYRNAAETWSGLLKNAAEGLGAPKTILPMTALLVGGQVLPWIGLIFAQGQAWRAFLAAGILGIVLRAMTALRFRQSWFGVLTHPLGVAGLMLIQWVGLIRHLLGKESRWKGRAKL